MRLTVRAKVMAIVGAAGLAFLVLLVASTLIERQIERELTEIRVRYVPRLELGPKLQRELELLVRGIQDATSAQDLDALAATAKVRDQLLATLASGRSTLSPGDLTALRAAFTDYYASASDVARRLIADEPGEGLVEAMSAMQAKQVRAGDLLVRATAIDQGEVAEAFSSAARQQERAVQVRLAITLSCMLVVLALALGLGRSVLRSVSELGKGLERFGRNDFSEPIRVTGQDELGQLAEQANQMAASLKRLGEERDRTDWLKEGHAGLTRELRGQLEPQDVASRAVRYLARYLDAPLGLFYAAQQDGSLELLAHYGGAFAAGEPTIRRFEKGQGLVGQAASELDISVITSLPESYLRVRSGLGEARPVALVLAPLSLVGRATGVLELALFKPWTETDTELLRSVQETVAIALEVARSRAALRNLLAETQRQAERLTAQEEEQRATNDELQSQQEELQAQQEELRQTNDELTTQSKELIAQQRALEHKNAELDDARARLEQKADELANVSAYKSQFLANMSHELRTPLNSMLLLSSLLAQNEAKNLTEKQVEFCKTIHGAGEDLLALINQVLDLAKIESGKQEAAIELVAVPELAAYAQRIFAPMARDKGLTFTAEVSDAAPEMIASDKRRIEQILNNLLGNAIKFTERGSVSLRIGLPDEGATFQRDDLERTRTLAISVIDTGIGIAPEHQESVFVPFEQVDGRPDRRYGGTGLGLSIGRELAGLLGGELQVQSTPGSGSTFICYLPHKPARPFAKATQTPHAKAANPKAETSMAPDAVRVADDRDTLAVGDAHLLVIEDDPLFAEIVGDVIHDQGLKLIIASDGKTGLQLATERKPSGVILDVRLPDLDGFAVMEALRADPETAAIPVHFVSAIEAGERGMALGAIGYLTKPATRRDIVRVVESIAPKNAARTYRVLVVEDDIAIADSLVGRLAGDEIETRRANSAGQALELLRNERFGCMVLDLSLPDMDGLELLRMLREERGAQAPPVIVYTGRALSKAETQRLEAYTEAVVLKGGTGAERLLDEVRLFARRLKAGLPASRHQNVQPQPTPVDLAGKRLLLVDDDMRTVYALSAVLRSKGAEVFIADTGRAALDMLEAQPDVDVVLMDIMMPEMDGYEAIRRIRADSRFHDLPIIALTAKAMKGDREKCIEVGATDYLSKPIDPDALAQVLHARLTGASPHGA